MSNAALEPVNYVGVRNIIVEHMPELRGQQELDLDLDKLNTRLLRKLERFVNNQTTWSAKFAKAMNLRKQRSMSGHQIAENIIGNFRTYRRWPSG